MLKRRSIFSTLVVLLAACASGAPPEVHTPTPDSDLEPVGIYDLVVVMNGMEIAAKMTIERDGRGWVGHIESDAGEASCTEIEVEGDRMTFNIPEAEARVVLHMHGDRVTGEMEGGMGMATITGTRR